MTTPKLRNCQDNKSVYPFTYTQNTHLHRQTCLLKGSDWRTHRYRDSFSHMHPESKLCNRILQVQLTVWRRGRVSLYRLRSLRTTARDEPARARLHLRVSGTGAHPPAATPSTKPLHPLAAAAPRATPILRVVRIVFRPLQGLTPVLYMSSRGPVLLGQTGMLF